MPWHESISSSPQIWIKQKGILSSLALSGNHIEDKKILDHRENKGKLSQDYMGICR